MKFRVTMKDPDTLSDAINEAAKKMLAAVEGMDTDRELLVERRCEELSTLANNWFEYGEYVTIEIDTEAKTAIVCER